MPGLNPSVALLVVGAAAVLLWPAGRPRVLGDVLAPGNLAAYRRWLAARWVLRLAKRVSRGTAWFVVVIVGLLAAAAAGPVAALLAATGAGIAVSAIRARRVAGIASARRGAELEILAALSAELRSGRHLVAALNAVPTPVDAELETALSAARGTAALGGDVSASLRHSGAVDAALSKLAAAWQISEDCGAPLADLAAQVSRDVKAIADLRRAADIELTGARATGLVLAVLPLLGVGLGAAMGAHPLQVLLHTPAGAVCASGGLVFELAGLAWIRRLTRGALGCAG